MQALTYLRYSSSGVAGTFLRILLVYLSLQTTSEPSQPAQDASWRIMAFYLPLPSGCARVVNFSPFSGVSSPPGRSSLEL
ncbi:hypothetical protein F4780DRAFT_572258 [Xylariomycetidae sp. FL0641]|nr:hypothetical protein F4780DRAFT_572258 [Xylariomycetidae sp. FL0641]